MNRTGVWVGIALGAVAAAALAAHRAPPVKDEHGAARKPVLVELFTSEGCSSCPPADALLSKLDFTQPIPGAQAIVLSEHVTYWDHEGWRDPYSLDAVTERQRWYSDKFGLNDIYTPQAVVDGAAQFVGSDGHKLAQAMMQAAAKPKEELTITQAAWTSDGVHFAVHGGSAGDKPKRTLVAALAVDSAQTSVKSGENAGRTLYHVAVVRVLKEFGSGAEDGRVLAIRLPGDNATGSSASLRLVVFLVDKRSGHVLGVAEQIVTRG